jgi:hypothetical protein
MVNSAFVALVFWAWLLGGLGAILAIPMTLLIKALLIDTDPKAAWADAFMRATAKGTRPECSAQGQEVAQAQARTCSRSARRRLIGSTPRTWRPGRPARPHRQGRSTAAAR